MEAVKLKKLSNPGTASYDTVAAAMKDPLILAKLQFYMALARTFTPFLKKYQTDEPVLPFLQKDLTEAVVLLQEAAHPFSRQATVERGFSINKEDNIKEDTVVTRRLVCDYITQHGGVTQVPLSKAPQSVARARTRYRAHLKTERKKREAKSQALKRKEGEDCLQELKVKRRRIQEVCEGLARDADRLAEEAERKAGNRMADLISRSNLFGDLW
ncbi:hypothetical protein HF521_014184 [Silurus meridionalis]|uniref:Uncharacterized protein n=1 Tax=Silurus meridionalis TaxID=175797 RepID=A0A8T0AB11_SILME|nr:hypothetical protein HF521_014184 [Silurus meridionalis]